MSPGHRIHSDFRGCITLSQPRGPSPTCQISHEKALGPGNYQAGLRLFSPCPPLPKKFLIPSQGCLTKKNLATSHALNTHDTGIQTLEPSLQLEEPKFSATVLGPIHITFPRFPSVMCRTLPKEVWESGLCPPTSGVQDDVLEEGG